MAFPKLKTLNLASTRRRALRPGVALAAPAQLRCENFAGARLAAEPDLAERLVPGASPAQAGRLLTTYARAAHHPAFHGRLDAHLTALCVRHHDTLALPAIDVATHLEAPAPLIDALRQLTTNPATPRGAAGRLRTDRPGPAVVRAPRRHPRRVHRARHFALLPYFWHNGQYPDSAEYQALFAGNFADYRLRINGLVDNPVELDLVQLRALPHHEQITQHFCIPSAIHSAASSTALAPSALAESSPVASWNWRTTSAASRPRSLTFRPCARAHFRAASLCASEPLLLAPPPEPTRLGARRRLAVALFAPPVRPRVPCPGPRAARCGRSL